VMSGKPQAGLPPLNGGTILGFLAGLAVMGWMG
jgi:presenilin-like A22 family membrane protease